MAWHPRFLEVPEATQPVAESTLLRITAHSTTENLGLSARRSARWASLVPSHAPACDSPSIVIPSGFRPNQLARSPLWAVAMALCKEELVRSLSYTSMNLAWPFTARVTALGN